MKKKFEGIRGQFQLRSTIGKGVFYLTDVGTSESDTAIVQAMRELSEEHGGTWGTMTIDYIAWTM